MSENVKKTYIQSDHNYGSECARRMVLKENESRRGVLQNVLVKIQKND
jgi:hypothetical protein